MSISKKLVFSGVQPTGNLHLGNYLGALKNFVSLQKEMECIYCVVDLHAITAFQDPKHLKENINSKPKIFLMHGANDTIVPPTYLLEAKTFSIASSSAISILCL